MKTGSQLGLALAACAIMTSAAPTHYTLGQVEHQSFKRAIQSHAKEIHGVYEPSGIQQDTGTVLRRSTDGIVENQDVHEPRGESVIKFAEKHEVKAAAPAPLKPEETLKPAEAKPDDHAKAEATEVKPKDEPKHDEATPVEQDDLGGIPKFEDSTEPKESKPAVKTPTMVTVAKPEDVKDEEKKEDGDQKDDEEKKAEQTVDGAKPEDVKKDEEKKEDGDQKDDEEKKAEQTVDGGNQDDGDKKDDGDKSFEKPDQINKEANINNTPSLTMTPFNPASATEKLEEEAHAAKLPCGCMAKHQGQHEDSKPRSSVTITISSDRSGEGFRSFHSDNFRSAFSYRMDRLSKSARHNGDVPMVTVPVTLLEKLQSEAIVGSPSLLRIKEFEKADSSFKNPVDDDADHDADLASGGASSSA